MNGPVQYATAAAYIFPQFADLEDLSGGSRSSAICRTDTPEAPAIPASPLARSTLSQAAS